MRKLSRFITACTVVVMLMVSFIPGASAVTKRITILSNQVWSQSYAANHNGNYSRAGAKCVSVYPISGIDLFKRIQCTIWDRDSNIISAEEYVVLNEDNKDYTPIKLKEGYIDVDVIYFKFRGNSSASAIAYVDYVGTLVE